MKIIVEGHEIETKDIWDIEFEANSREVYVLIRLSSKPDIKIGRRIPYETYQSEYEEYYRPYKKLYKSVNAKWEADKTDIEIFKL